MSGKKFAVLWSHELTTDLRYTEIIREGPLGLSICETKSTAMEEVKRWLESSIRSNENLIQLKSVGDSMASEAYFKVKSGVALMEAATTEQVEEVKVIHFKKDIENSVFKPFNYRESFRELLKSTHFTKKFSSAILKGVYLANENRGYSSATLATALLFLHRGSRRFLVRNTMGWLRNEEAELAAAERKIKDLKANLNVYSLDKKKLQERAEAAQKEFTSGRGKLKATASELLRLWNNVKSTETKAARLRESLRDLPFRESLKLRTEVASALSEVKQHKAEIGKRLNQISKFGVTA